MQIMALSETKFFDQLYNLNVLAPATFASNVTELTDIVQGASQTLRIGNAINVSGMYGRMAIFSNDVAAAQFLRVIIYTPRIISSTVLPSASIQGMIDPDQFVVWYDKTFVPSFQQGSGLGFFEIRKKWNPYMKVLYDNFGASTVSKNKILVELISAQSSGVSVTGTIRLYFKDL